MSAQIIPFTGERPIDRAWRAFQQHTLMGREKGLLDDLDWCYENWQLHAAFYRLAQEPCTGGNVIQFPRRA